MPLSSNKPGNGLFGWLGRQFGHISRAIKTDVAGPKTIYRESQIEEQTHPDDPNVKLRRTTIDEVIVQKPVNQIEQPNADDRTE
jgi:hypothetical protein